MDNGSVVLTVRQANWTDWVPFMRKRKSPIKELRLSPVDKTVGNPVHDCVDRKIRNYSSVLSNGSRIVIHGISQADIPY